MSFVRLGWAVALLTPWVGASRIAGAGIDGVLYVSDSSSDRIVGLTDLNGSGFVEMEVPGEITVFYDDSSPGPDLSTPSHLAQGPGGGLILADGGTLDALFVIEDLNGDGDANDEGEVWTFYDASGGGPKLSTANSVVRAPDGSYYVADDGSGAKRILRLQDLNGDRDALDADESRIVYDATALSVPVIGDMESMALGWDGGIFVGDTTLQAVYRLHDANGDGDYLDEGELVLFYQVPAGSPLADLDALLAVEPAVYAGDNDSGQILRLVDGNGDGDADDEGESLPFLDATSAVRVGSAADMLHVPGIGFVVLDNSKDAVLVLSDLNEDSDALDADEVYRWLKDDGSTLATPSGLVLAARKGEPPPPPLARFLRGDATADGKLDISDPVTTLGYLFLGRVLAACIDSLDSDDSGVVNISDPIYALNFLFTGGPAPPPPFPEPGADPTSDSMACAP